MRADFAGFASVSGAKENEQRQVLANFIQANIDSVGGAVNLMLLNIDKTGVASITNTAKSKHYGENLLSLSLSLSLSFN